MKKRARKLKLQRETLRHLSSSQVEGVAGGTTGTEETNCGSCDCSASCQFPGFTNCQKTFCICPDTGI